jgi:pimeloyl-ACP methyl ester carboxylesterase
MTSMFGQGLIAIVGTVGVCLGVPAAVSAGNGHASVDGLDMYYEIYDAGRPLVLLHGALMTIDAFGDHVPPLAKARRAMAVAQQAHGRTADRDRPFGYEQMADAAAALLRGLEIEEADIFGNSMDKRHRPADGVSSRRAGA